MSNPLIRINEKIGSFTLDVALYTRVTFLSGDSGMGKTFLFTRFQTLATNPRFGYIKCIDVKTSDIMINIERLSKDTSNLIVLDHGDFLMNNRLRELIIDGEATFLIFARECYGLAWSKYSISEFAVVGDTLTNTFPLSEV